MGQRLRERKEKRKQRKEEKVKQTQKIEEQEKISNYYPPSPIYDSHQEDEILPNHKPQEKLKLDPNYYPQTIPPELEDALVLLDSLVPAPTSDKDERGKEDMQKECGRKIQNNFEDEDYEPDYPDYFY